MSPAPVSLAAINERIEAARGDALEEVVRHEKEHAANVALFLNRLSESVEGLGMVPEETVQNLLRAASTFATKGGPR